MISRIKSSLPENEYSEFSSIITEEQKQEENFQ